MKNSIPAVEVGRSSENFGIEYLAVKLILEKKEITVVNVYCSPEKELNLFSLPTTDENLVILGDFNSHSPSWGYEEMNTRGEQVEDWMIEKNLLLINKPSDPPTFWSRTWKKSTCPDLAFATENLEKIAERTVSDQLGSSDHRPVILKIHKEGCARSFCKEPSWNYKRANWKKYQVLTTTFCKKKKVTESEDIDTNVKNFTEAILEAAKWSIPRGKRSNYKPYWSEEMEQKHEQVIQTHNEMVSSKTTETVAAHNRAVHEYEETKTNEIRRAWYEKTESLDMERDGGKVWKLTKTLNEDYQDKFKSTVLEENGQLKTGKQASNLWQKHIRQTASWEYHVKNQQKSGKKSNKKAREKAPLTA